jgi:biotin carboxylase
LGPAGYHVEVLDSDPLCIARFSRWASRVHRVPAASLEPLAYLESLRRVVEERKIDVVLPTHEQAWLFAAAARLLSDVPVAVAEIDAFDRVQSKIELARLLDQLGLPQPAWRVIASERDLDRLPFPYWLKSPFSTAGQGVRHVVDERSRAAACGDLLDDSDLSVIAQAPAQGEYGQVQALFDRGRLLAAHTSVGIGIGIGPSAAARLSVEHPEPRRHVAKLGAALHWHGGLTLDYFHSGGAPQFIECNPRTVEPANATAAGVNIPALQVSLTMGGPLPARTQEGRAGVRTHGTIALVLGAAAYRRSRQAVVGELVGALARRGHYRASSEQLTPLLRDPPSLVALAYIAGYATASPAGAAKLAERAVARYSVTPETVAEVVSALRPAERSGAPGSACTAPGTTRADVPRCS